MRFLIIAIFVVFHLNKTQAVELQTGDVILQPLKCWSCSLITAQEKSEFAHIGIVVKKENQIFVAEAYGEVQLVTLEKFLEKNHPDKKAKYIRLKLHKNLDPFVLSHLIQGYIGNPYDAQFGWNNFKGGKELMYCSELVYKVLEPLVSFNDLSPKPMLFDVNPDYWDRFFRGETPRGEDGISPEDFNKSLDFFELKAESI